jgi:hypothetical protein
MRHPDQEDAVTALGREAQALCRAFLSRLVTIKASHADAIQIVAVALSAMTMTMAEGHKDAAQQILLDMACGANRLLAEAAEGHRAILAEEREVRRA